MEVKVFDTRYGIYVFSRLDGYLGQIDTTYIDKEIYGIEGLYLNRLIVHEEVRGRGIATQMMNGLIGKADKKQINLILEINAYGNLNEEKLQEFYKRFGFVESELEGLYVRFSNLVEKKQ